MNFKSILNRFPVQAALVALLVYLATLSGGVTIYSVPLTAKVAGWDYQPMTSHPLFWLLTLPVRWLPAGWIPLALNLFSALCAAITLGFLAATLELAAWKLSALPGWRARLPLVLGLALCGLEFNFWQSATQATGEALQVLLLAAAVWCLFHYRAAREPRWLWWAAFIWGLGMVENWMMLATLPVFVAAALWLVASLFLLKKLRAIPLGDLGVFALAGLAGFSFFAVLPTVNGLWPGSPLSFGGAWWSALKEFKASVFFAYVNFPGRQRSAFLVVLVYFLLLLLPLLPALIRMPDKAAPTFSFWDRYQVGFFRVLRAALLFFCLWLAFDPVLGLRHLLRDRFGVAMPLLSFDYLVGLSAGFLGGNLLLALAGTSSRRHRYQPAGLGVLTALAVPVFLALLALVSLGLLVRNAPAITLSNRQPFSQYGKMVMKTLPPGGGIVLSDEPTRLLSFQAAAVGPPGREWLALNTDLLPKPEYRRWLDRRFPGQWTAGATPGVLTPVEIVATLQALARSNRVFYLHSCFGAQFETAYLQPAGLAAELTQYPDRAIHPPALPAGLIQTNEAFWDSLAPQMAALRKTCAAAEPGRPGLGARLGARLSLKPVPPVQSRLLAQWYAAALDDWGVQLSRAGQAAVAQNHFEQALELCKHNIAALVNFQCQTSLAAGSKLSLAGVPDVAARLDGIASLYKFVLACGPVDEPAFCYVMGVALRRAGLPRQALQQLKRAADMVPGSPAPRLALAELYTSCNFHEQARQAIDKIRRDVPPGVLKTNYVAADLSLLDARLWLSQTNLPRARASLQSLLNEYPGDQRVENLVLNAYLGFGDVTNALHLLDIQLARTPGDVEKLNVQASVLMQSGRASEAVTVLDHVLTLTNLPAIRPNHALAQLRAKNYEAAESEFLELEAAGIAPAMVSYGLAAIAEHRADTNLIRHYLEICQTNAPPGSRLRHEVTARLEALKTNGNTSAP
jgi:tetratricopeptide (TPR) repeat protein